MDLNIVIELDKVRDSVGLIHQKIKRCLKLGLKGIALSVYVNGSQINDIPPPIRLDSNVLGLTSNRKFEFYSRLTVAISDGIQLHKLGHSQIVKQYDLLAIEPMNDKVFTQILTGNFDCDIITFNFNEKSPLNLRKANFSVPKSKGILMEINYGQAIVSQSSRHHVIAYGQTLVRKTKGKNILLSSGAQSANTIRDSSSVSNLGLLFELKENQTKEAVYLNCLRAIRKSKIRKNPAVAALNCEPLAENEKWAAKVLTPTSSSISSSVENPEQCSSPKRIKMEVT